MSILNKKVLILIGHYGTGKTTISLNFALEHSKSSSMPIAVVDLDVNNPYFRSRDWLTTLEKSRIEVIMPEEKIAFAEMPYLPKEVYSVIQNPKRQVIIDVGGHDVGTTVLGSISDKVKSIDYDLYMVINKYRPEMGTVDEIIQMIYRLEKLSKLKVTGLINNTNLGTATELQDLIDSEKIVEEVSKRTGIQFIGTTVVNQLQMKVRDILKSTIIPIERFELYKFR